MGASYNQRRKKLSSIKNRSKRRINSHLANYNWSTELKQFVASVDAFDGVAGGFDQFGWDSQGHNDTLKARLKGMQPLLGLTWLHLTIDRHQQFANWARKPDQNM